MLFFWSGLRGGKQCSSWQHGQQLGSRVICKDSVSQTALYDAFYDDDMQFEFQDFAFMIKCAAAVQVVA